MQDTPMNNQQTQSTDFDFHRDYRNLLEKDESIIGINFNSLNINDQTFFLTQLQNAVFEDKLSPETIFKTLSTRLESANPVVADENAPQNKMQQIVASMQENEGNLYGTKMHQNLQSIAKFNQDLIKTLAEDFNARYKTNYDESYYTQHIATLPGIEFAQKLAYSEGNDKKIDEASKILQEQLIQKEKNFISSNDFTPGTKVDKEHVFAKTASSNKIKNIFKNSIDSMSGELKKEILNSKDLRLANSPIKNLLNDVSSTCSVIYPHARTLGGSVAQAGITALKTAGVIVLAPVLLAYEAGKIGVNFVKSLGVNTYKTIKNSSSLGFKQSLSKHSKEFSSDMKKAVQNANPIKDAEKIQILLKDKLGKKRSENFRQQVKVNENNSKSTTAPNTNRSSSNVSSTPEFGNS